VGRHPARTKAAFVTSSARLWPRSIARGLHLVVDNLTSISQTFQKCWGGGGSGCWRGDFTTPQAFSLAQLAR